MKNNYRFLAIIKNENESVGVYFQYFDGCITGSDTVNIKTLIKF